MKNRIIQPGKPQNYAAPKIEYPVGRKFEVVNRDDSAEILIYDVIGYDFWTGEGVTAKSFRKELEQISASKITVRINSPGGDVFDGIAIYNELVDHPAEIHVVISGLAASIASVIAMAGDKVTIETGAMMMIHNASTMCWGNKNDMTRFAKTLAEVDRSIQSVYMTKVNVSEADIESMMDAETWFTADEAVKHGFADEAAGDDGQTVKAAYDISFYANAPASAKKKIESVLREAGYSNTESKAAVNKGFHVLGQREAGGHDDHREQREAAGGTNELADDLRKLIAALKGQPKAG